MTSVERQSLYRLPWSLHDNPIAWIEITDVCNLACAGCYRATMTGHKSLAQVREEIDLMRAWRNPDNVSISGGEPLLHPDLLAIVAYIRACGLKPVLLTNGLLLDVPRIRALKNAGLTGFTLHVDSTQARPGWESCDEVALNALRLDLARMIAAVPGLLTVFNATVTTATLAAVPALTRWACDHAQIVHGLVFITHRHASLGEHSASDAHGALVDPQPLGYVQRAPATMLVTAAEINRAITRAIPEYQPAGFLGGTATHISAKWLVGVVFVAGQQVLGPVGRRTVELTQVMHHLLHGCYMAYLVHSRMSILTMLLAVIDPVFRRTTMRAWLAWLLRRPWRVFTRVRALTIGIIQAPDILADGRVDMCDGCPDITWHEGQMVNSCRLDECRLFGTFLTPARREPHE